MSTDKNRIKTILREKRLERDLTLREIGDAVGVSEATVSRWESGEISNMRRDRIFAYAKILGISPLVIMGHEEPVSDDKLKKFTDIVSTMSDEEMDDVMNYMQFIISKRK